jgi:hypothetical protein
VLKKILPSLFSSKKERGALNMRGQTRMIRKRADAEEPSGAEGADASAVAGETVKRVLETARAGAASAPAAAEQAKAPPQTREALIAEALAVRRKSAKILDDLDPELRFRVVAAALAQTRGILGEDR